MNKTKDTKLTFIRDLSERAERSGSGLIVHANLGMAAIELVRKGEMLGLLPDYPLLTADNVESTIKQLVINHVGGLDDCKTFRLGELKVYNPINEREWIGAAVIDEGDVLERERQIVAESLFDLTGEDMELVPVEFFLNIGIIDAFSEGGVDDIIDYVGQKLPETVDVYDVDVRRGHLYIPQ